MIQRQWNGKVDFLINGDGKMNINMQKSLHFFHKN